MSVTERRALDGVYEYCRSCDWQGDDPYDGLKSRVFGAMPFSSNRAARIAQIQFFKRSPVNLRRLARVEISHNPKALGLFLSAATALHEIEPLAGYREDAYHLAGLLDGVQSKGWSGACWGYDFPWEARAFSQPSYAPTVVATSFVANAFLDAWEQFGEDRFRDVARSACDFVMSDLNRTGTAEALCFSYSPTDETQVYNASLLGAQLLARVSRATGEDALMDTAMAAARFVAKRQEPDGSWLYGTLPYHRWTDSFHTGYVLVALADCIDLSGDETLRPALEKGYRFYADMFFGSEGEPVWSPEKRFPFDTHNAAQGILTFVRMDDVPRARQVARWATENMRAPSGFYYYRKGRFGTVRIPYMRWCQAFMTLALARLVRAAP